LFGHADKPAILDNKVAFSALKTRILNLNSIFIAWPGMPDSGREAGDRRLVSLNGGIYGVLMTSRMTKIHDRNAFGQRGPSYFPGQA
jgi:hypothetical protein